MSWHSGKIWTENNNCNSNGQLREGTTFYIILPLSNGKTLLGEEN
jgi:signal transduction histidine kinase